LRPPRLLRREGGSASLAGKVDSTIDSAMAIKDCSDSGSGNRAEAGTSSSPPQAISRASPLAAR